MKAACPRLFEVEALRDGRLTGAELVRFQGHLELCAVCAREQQALQDLAEALRSPANSATADELHIRRERTRLLAAFDASLVPAPRSSRAKLGRRNLWLGSAAAIAVLSALAVSAGVFWPAPAVPPPLATAPEPITIRADSSAKWSRQVEDQLDKIVLESGALSIRVAHAGAPRRLLVILPDGELEDIGTTFSVSAAAGHTTRITVQDGSVVLRLHGKPPLALGAGDTWSPPPAPAAMPVASSAQLAPTTPPLTPALRGAKAAPPAAPAAGASVQTPPPDAAADFREAMAAFNSGDNARAASRFAAFLSQHPRDPRAEDALYLRVLALQRVGNAPATQQAARDYLTRYPHGFRRAEVEALSR